MSEGELQTSAIQYEVGMNDIPNIKGISDSRRFEEYKKLHPGTAPLSYIRKIKRAWVSLLDEVILRINDELR